MCPILIYSTSKRRSGRLMEGVEGLYKKFGVLADAKDKAGEVCIKNLTTKFLSKV